ncbi:MAG: 7-cyano-7-deazaguanine synthase QueC [Planctomycetaceae bacterium]|nr:7-cyano-7-deazaguanine synthase QueC [Planctomycetaceae bacterium]
MKVVVILSGGIDSTTLLYHLKAEGHSVFALTFDYGQRHRKELRCAASICQATNTPNQKVCLTALADVFGGNALTDHSVTIQPGRYDEQTLAVTTVPNRNMILLSVAIGKAVSLGYHAVAFGAHAGAEGHMYADCSPAFAAAMNQVAAVCDRRPIEVLAPFVNWKKADIIRRASELGVPFELTWSCYQGEDVPCGRCGTCLDRSAAFEDAGLSDPLSGQTT